MPIFNRESNAPVNMLPWVRALEATIQDLQTRLAAAESTIRGQR